MTEKGEDVMPDPALKYLDVLVGTWNVEGETRAGPADPAGRVDGVETFEWLEGGFFLVHRWESFFSAASAGWDTTTVGNVSKGVQFFGYDATSKQYRTHFFDNSGPYDASGSTYEGEVVDGILTFTGPARITRVVSDDGNIMTSRFELPSDDSAWVPWMDLTYTKVE